jgi:hypothetical protein
MAAWCAVYSSARLWLCAADTRSSDADSQFLKELAAVSDDAKGGEGGCITSFI